MAEADSDAKLPERLARSLEELGFFLGHRELDDPRKVAGLISAAGLEQLLELRFIDSKRLFYIVEPSRRPCRSRCWSECRRGGDPGCQAACEQRCLDELRRRVAEALRNAARRGRRGRPG